MARGIIGKALRGAAAVATPAALDMHRANIQKKRDEYLAGVRKTETAQAQTFQAEQAELERASRQPGRELQQEKTQKNIQQIDLALESAKIDLEAKKEIDALKEQYLAAPEGEQKEQLLQTLSGLKGKGQAGRFKGFTISEEAASGIGTVSKFLTLDSGTGEITYHEKGAAAPNFVEEPTVKAKATPIERFQGTSKEDAIKQIMDTNKVTREQASRFYENLREKYGQ